jgi:iron complex outermembrane receptor protein
LLVIEDELIFDYGRGKLKKLNLAKALSASLKCSVALPMLLGAGLAYAQDAAPAEEEAAADVTDIVVTGTLIRGIAPAGTNVIGVDSKKVAETGATNTAQLFQTIPQLGSFNNLQIPTGGFTNVTTNRPNLRNLPGFNTSGSSPTLVLVDGHRVVGAGISVTSPDADIVPPGMIERVEIVPDGGSAIYGSDAVAGVINFITKKKADGLELGGHFGFADDYYAFDVNATAGHSWGTGSIIVSYNFSKHDILTGGDRDYSFYPPGRIIGGLPVASLQCSPGNVTVGLGGTAIDPVIGGLGNYALNPDGTLGAINTANSCDLSDGQTLYPAEKRHSVMAGLNQELTDNLTFDVRAFYTNRQNYSINGANVQTTNIGPSFLASFGFISSPFAPATPLTGNCDADPGPVNCTPFATQAVNYQYGGRNAGDQRVGLETWGVAPAFTLNLGGNYRLKWISSYGESVANYRGRSSDSTTLNNLIIAGLFNPYNASAASNNAAVGILTDFTTYARTQQRQFNSRLTLDGDLFELPGGAVKIAVGAEYSNENFTARNGRVRTGTEDTGYAGLTLDNDLNVPTLITPAYSPLRPINFGRNVKSAFGEVVVPIFGAENATGGFQELTFSAAGRYDDYSDFGGTFNPKFGLTWKPIDWIKLRGAYGKSFVAPSLADQPGASSTSVSIVSIPFLYPNASLIGTTVNGQLVPEINGRQVAIVLGNAPGIQPQRATTISVGVDIEPPFVPGLRLSATYYKINYTGAIAIPNFTGNQFYNNFIGTPQVVFEPSEAAVNGVLALAAGSGGISTITGTSCGGNCYAIVDARKTNLASFKTSGLDFAANYFTQTGFGSIDFSFNGSYDLARTQQAVPGAAFLDQIGFNTSRFKFRTSLGADIGAFRAQVTLNHNSGYAINPPVGVVTTQRTVAAFNTVDLFFKYDLAGEGALKNTALTLNVNNVFDADPPLYLALNELTPAVNGFQNGGTIGRFIQFGINKRF